MDPRDHFMEGEPKPDWFLGFTDQYMIVGAQLCTRDGRKIGNARVQGLFNHSILAQVAEIRTDAGTMLILTENELKELFYQPTMLIKDVGA